MKEIRKGNLMMMTKVNLGAVVANSVQNISLGHIAPLQSPLVLLKLRVEVMV